jgi:hypothetical protein
VRKLNGTQTRYDDRSVTWPGGNDGRIDDRERRVIRNEALFREVNERIEDVNAEVSRSDLIEFLCECGEETCLDPVELTREEYEGVRSVSDHFAMRPGHEHPDFERVIDRRDRYVVIEKVGQAEDVADRTDPRT